MRAKGIVLLLILNFILPMGSIADDKPYFEATFFDKNADGIDDRMNFLIEEKLFNKNYIKLSIGKKRHLKIELT